MSGDHNENVNKAVKAKKEDKDSHLKNWSTWLKTWENIQKTLSEKLNMSPDQLLMNYGDGIEMVNAEKLLLQYAKIPCNFDKYRGNPTFWKVPLSLPRKYKCCRREPDYFAIQTKEEKYIVPSLELKVNPQLYSKEKNILSNARTIYTRWQNSKYRTEQVAKYYNRIKEILPHYPSSQKLKEEETKIQQKEVKQEPSIPSVDNIIEIREEYVVKEITGQPKKSSEKLLRLSKRSLKINGIVFDSTTSNNGTSRQLRINFEYDVSSKIEALESIVFENNGITTLRISWKKLDKFRLFRNYTEEKRECGFYFNKNDLILLPGQKLKFPVWFKIDTAGTYSESWELLTTPKIWKEDFHVKLILHSYAFYKDLKEKVELIVEYINIQSRNNIIKDILRSVVEEIKYKEVLVTPCYYTEAQLFEMANLINGKPFYLYNEEIVNELKNIYVKLKKNNEDWSYSVEELEELAHDKDTTLYLENNKNEVAKKIASSEVMKVVEVEKSQSKPKKTNKDVKKDKKESSPKKLKSTTELEPTLPEIKKENFIYSNQLELREVVKQLDSPIIINTEREKFFACTAVVSGYFTKMCNLLDLLEIESNIQRNTYYPKLKHKMIPISQQPKQKIYEYFEDHHLPSGRVDLHYFAEAKPKPKMLEDIEDVETIYELYFKKGITHQKEESKIKDKKGKKTKEKLLKKEKSKSTEKIKKEPSVESFDPFAEIFRYDSLSDSGQIYNPRSRESQIISSSEMEDYKYKQYITVYSCLSEAVDAIVDTIESFDCIVSHATLKEVKDDFE